MLDELWAEVQDIVQEKGSKTIPKKKKSKKAKWLSEEDLQIAVKRREVKNRFKGLDLIEFLMNYGQRFMTLYRKQESRPSSRKRNAKKQHGCLRRTYK